MIGSINTFLSTKGHAMTTTRDASAQAPAAEKGMNRRTFLTAATAIAATGAAAMGRDYSKASGPVRYPDPDIIAFDKRFNLYKLGNTPIQRIYHSKDLLWAEGPAWNGVGRYLIWSDIPNDRQMRYLDEDGHISENFRNPAGNSNGNTFDYQGRELSCEHGNRRVVRYEYDGKLTVLADKFEGKPFNAPNDVVVHPNGDIWFTDPGYGSMMNYEGNKGPLHLKESVYRIDGKTGAISVVTKDMDKPNGLCFSPDYKKLYVADTGAPKNIAVFDVVDDKSLGKYKEFVSMKLEGFDKPGNADGIRADVDGNIWASAGWIGDGYDGVHIFAPDGIRIGQIKLPEICSNVCFGGKKRNRLFMTASQSVYAVYVETQGAHIT